MHKTFRDRLARLEAAGREPGPLWSIPIDICEMEFDSGRAVGRVVGRIPSRLIEPGQGFDYQQVITDLATAMGHEDEPHV